MSKAIKDSEINVLEMMRVLKPCLGMMSPLIHTATPEGMYTLQRMKSSAEARAILHKLAPLLPMMPEGVSLKWLSLLCDESNFRDSGGKRYNNAMRWACLLNALAQKWSDHQHRCAECRRMPQFMVAMTACAGAFPHAMGSIQRAKILRWHTVFDQLSQETGTNIVAWMTSAAARSFSAASSSSSSSVVVHAPIPRRLQLSPPLSPEHRMNQRTTTTAAAAEAAAGTDSTGFCEVCGDMASLDERLVCTNSTHHLCTSCHQGIVSEAEELPKPLCPLCQQDDAVLLTDDEQLQQWEQMQQQRKNIGLTRIDQMEEQNEQFVEEFPVLHEE